MAGYAGMAIAPLRILLVCLAAMPLCGAAMAGVSDQEAKIQQVKEVVSAVSGMPESIPAWLLEKAQAIAIIPAVIKVGLVIGGRYGEGVILVRQPDDSWSGPAFLSITGGSVGWQIGAQSTDVILVFGSAAGVASLVDGKFTLGADASVAAGPVGREASAATDVTLDAEIYSYSRSRGLFAGVALEGAHLKIEHDDNALYYHRENITPQQIFQDQAPLPQSARALAGLLERHAGSGQ